MESIPDMLGYFCGRLCPAKEGCTDIRALILIPDFISRYLISWRPLLDWGFSRDWYSRKIESFSQRAKTMYEAMETVRAVHRTQTSCRKCQHQLVKSCPGSLSLHSFPLSINLWFALLRPWPSRVDKPIIHDSELSTEMQLVKNVNVSMQPALFMITFVLS